jgi:arylsulfatase A-like enzyme
VRFIEANRSRPFFLYLAHSLPHVPLARDAAFVGRSAGGLYGDVIEELDWSTGRVLDALAQAGLDRQTLVVFTSDNGPWLPFGAHSGSPGPLANGKGTTWEGGVRAPTIFWWPGTIEPGVVTDIGTSMDVFVTAARLAGATLPEDREIDGVDLRAPMTGTGPSPRQVHFYYWDDELRAIRKGRYKAHFITSGAYALFGERRVHEPSLLFDLAVDPAERHDVASQHPKVVADLAREAEAHRKAMVKGPPLFDRVGAAR